MHKKPTWLLDHKADVYSQSGEDGIISAALDVLPELDNWCVEVGAWDGVYLSNTRHLIEDRGYHAVLIEGSKRRFADLLKNTTDSIIPINRYVGFTADDSLDSILKNTPVPRNFDLLSIDIDRNDYHVWEAITYYEPKIVCIEYNPTIPDGVIFVQPRDFKLNQGSSLDALVDLGKKEGYELVCVTSHNAFFVQADYFCLFGIDDNRVETLRLDRTKVTYIFSGFDGRVFLTGFSGLPWHGLSFSSRKIQRLPRLLQKYPYNYSSVERILFGLYSVLVEPGRLISLLRKLMGKKKWEIG